MLYFSHYLIHSTLNCLENVSNLESLEIAFEAVAEEDGFGREHAEKDGLNVANGRRHTVKVFSANTAESEK